MSLGGAAEWSFLQHAQVTVTAATVGIHRSRWCFVSTAERHPEAFERMKEHRFDILPIDPGQPSPVTEFFVTKEWGKWGGEHAIERQEISHTDVIDYQTSIFEVIRLMATSTHPSGGCRRYYFLGVSGEVVGLITEPSLNSRDTKIAVNAILIHLEDQLSQFVSDRVGVDRLKSYLGDETKEEFAEARRNNLDLQPVEYFYLKDLFNVVRKEGLYKELGYESGKLFDKIKALVKLRNSAMHAARSLVNRECDAARLYALIERARDLSFRLGQHRTRARSASQRPAGQID